MGILLRGIRRRDASYEPELQAAIAGVVCRGWTCADVGAHHGVFTRLLAQLVGKSGRVVAFEAHPENARVLKRSIRVGLRGRVTIENVAVTDGAAEQVTLHRGRGDASTEWNVVGHDVDGRPTAAELEVDAVSLDSYFAGARLDFVKVDVEGAEARVLQGARGLLRDSRPILAVEFHDETGWAGRSELLGAGYELRSIAGAPIEAGPGARRVYQCVATPA